MSIFADDLSIDDVSFHFLWRSKSISNCSAAPFRNVIVTESVPLLRELCLGTPQEVTLFSLPLLNEPPAASFSRLKPLALGPWLFSVPDL